MIVPGIRRPTFLPVSRTVARLLGTYGVWVGELASQATHSLALFWGSTAVCYAVGIGVHCGKASKQTNELGSKQFGSVQLSKLRKKSKHRSQVTLAAAAEANRGSRKNRIE